MLRPAGRADVDREVTGQLARGYKADACLLIVVEDLKWISATGP